LNSEEKDKENSNVIDYPEFEQIMFAKLVLASSPALLMYTKELKGDLRRNRSSL